MTTIKQSQLVKVNGRNVALPSTGDKVTGPGGERFVVVQIRKIGKARKGLYNGQFPGIIQDFEMDLNRI